MIYCDNFKFLIEAHGMPALKAALDIVFMAHSSVTHWAVDISVLSNRKRLIFFWSDPGPVYNGSLPALAAVPIGYKASAPTALAFIQQWLAEQDYGDQPDHDGSNSAGFRVEAGELYSAYGRYAAMVITPVWAEHGK